MNVWLALIPVFLLVGAWLIVYNNKRGALMREFAAGNSLVINNKGHSSLEAELDERFALPSPYARGFSLIRDVIDLPNGKLFRVTELLDLSQYGMAQNTHAGRIALYLPYEKGGEQFFLLTKAGGLQQIIPEYPLPANNTEGIHELQQFILNHSPKHDLIVTFKEGYLLAYHVPTRTGSESLSDLRYLAVMANSLSC